MMRRIIAAAILSLFAFSAFAQRELKVSGTVKDASGEPIPGAAVYLESKTTIGAVSDLDGNYTLLIPAEFSEKARLVFSCIGFTSITLYVGGRASLDAVLEEDTLLLDETVVVGYGSMRRSDLTGSVASVKIDDNDAARSNSLAELIQGRASGVQVMANSASPDTGISIRVRGLGSFNGNTEPLYVVDGIILNPPTTSETLFTQGLDNSDSNESVNGLMGLNPQDIASMEILKDASATAIYGAQGANGVVLITTKQANQDKPKVLFSAGVDVSQRNKRLGVLTFDEYVGYLENLGESKILSGIYISPLNHEGLKVVPVDWQDFTCRTAFGQRYYLSISGRPKETNYSFSIGINNKQGIVKTSDVQQYTMRLNLDKKFGNNITVGTRTNLAYVDSHLTQGANASTLSAATSLMRSMLTKRPYTVLDNEYNEEMEEEDEEYRSGPDLWLSDTVNNRKEYRVTPNIYVTLKILPWLNFKSAAGGDYRNYELIKWKSSRINRRAEGNIGAVGTYERLSWNWDNTFLFDKKFNGGHNLSGTLGMSAYRQSVRSQTQEGWHIAEYKALYHSLNSAPDALMGYNETDYSTLSFFVRAVYNYKDRYVLTSTYRIDGSSKFKKENRFSSFPSFAFAWRANQEPWFKAGCISMLKFRAGWGRVGNQSVSPYQTFSNYSSSKIPEHSSGNEAQGYITIYPSNLANSELRWETTEQLNAGVDLSLFGGRISFSADAYNKVTYDLLQSREVARASGFETIYMNDGTISNRGLELSAEFVPVKTGNLEWVLGGNISFNRNKIVSINESASPERIYVAAGQEIDAVYFLGSSIGRGSYANYPANISIEGYPMSLFYGFPTDGIVQEGQTGVPTSSESDPTPEGSVNYIDTNGNGYIDDYDRVIIGSPHPDFTFGFNTSFSFLKHWSVSASFNGSYGNDILNVNALVESDTSAPSCNHTQASVLDAWSPSNPNGKYPKLGQVSSVDMSHISDRFIEDGSFLRLSSLSLSYDYDFPRKNAKILKGFGLTLTAGNLFVLTAYSGWDPEVNSFGTDLKRMGVDSGSYPNCRTVSFDVKLKF